MTAANDRPLRGVRQATASDLTVLAATLGRAFDDDPVWRFAVRRSERFAERAGTIFGIVARLHIEDFDSVWMSDGGEAAAIWAPPGHPKVADRRYLRHAPTLLRALGLRSLGGLAVLDGMEKKHPKEPPHWYLAALGTDPDYQGRGFGGAVLQPVLDRCDSDGVPAFLESSKESNIPFYRRHGFEVIETLDLGGGCPLMFTMWREPDAP